MSFDVRNIPVFLLNTSNILKDLKNNDMCSATNLYDPVAISDNVKKEKQKIFILP